MTVERRIRSARRRGLGARGTRLLGSLEVFAMTFVLSSFDLLEVEERPPALS